MVIIIRYSKVEEREAEKAAERLAGDYRLMMECTDAPLNGG